MFFKKHLPRKDAKPNIKGLLLATLIDFQFLFLVIVLGTAYFCIAAPIQSFAILSQVMLIGGVVFLNSFILLLVAEFFLWNIEYKKKDQ